MAVVTKSQVWIAATPRRVFAYLADLTKHGEWSTHKLSIEAEGDGPLGVGSRFVSHGEQFGQSLTDTLTVTEYEPGRRFVFESAGRAGRWRHTYEVETERGGTRLTRAMSPATLSPLVRLISPLFGLGLPRRNAKDLERLKKRMESEGGG
ncbi:MAG: hypothetical protein GEU75_09695 [Dehalococcoidia bacterium]|nr:hypothetical protein [Dehalococcoidia bacterium]